MYLIAFIIAAVCITVSVAMTTFYVAMEITECLWWKKTIPPFPLVIFIVGVEWSIITIILWEVTV